MHVAVVVGSPKGNASVTLQSARWLERRFPEHRFTVHRVAQRIKRLERDPEVLRSELRELAAADLVLWTFPVYYFAVHAHLKRFFELALEQDDVSLAGGYAAGLSTSIHVMDHTAHAYVRAVSDDLGLRWLGSYSAHMKDLLDVSERLRLEVFFHNLVEDVERGAPGEPRTPPLPASSFVYQLGVTADQERVDQGSARVLIVDDLRWGDTSARHMTQRFRRAFDRHVDVVNLNDLDIAASCQGCLRCGWDNRCAFEGHDEFVPFYRERVETADVLVLAGTVRDRWLSSRWKTFFDRQFFENHRPVLEGKKIGLITAGPVGELPHLREAIEAWTETHHAELVGWVTDESHDSPVIDRQLDDLAFRLVRVLDADYVAPAGFRGVGTRKIFRDDVYSWMRFPFVSDHRTYRRIGYYDFPQNDYRSRAINTVYSALARVPPVRDRIYGELRQRMVAPYQALVEMTGNGGPPPPEEEAGPPAVAAGPEEWPRGMP